MKFTIVTVIKFLNKKGYKYELINDELAAHKELKSGDEIDGSDFDAITDSAAENLGQFKSAVMELNGLNTLSDAAAGSLGKIKVEELCLNDLETLTDSAAASLGNFKGDILTCPLWSPFPMLQLKAFLVYM